MSENLDDTTTSAPSTDDAYEDKISYNMLFWPYVQVFKAPNVVRCGGFIIRTTMIILISDVRKTTQWKAARSCWPPTLTRR